MYNSTAASDPRLQLLAAFRTQSSINLSSFNLDPQRRPSTTPTQVTRFRNSYSFPYYDRFNHYEEEYNYNNNSNSFPYYDGDFIDYEEEYYNDNNNTTANNNNNSTSSDILSPLPGVIVDEEKSNLPGGSEKKECAICLEEYETGEKIKWLPCMHSYHETCVAKWLQCKAVCPLCKLPLHV